MKVVAFYSYKGGVGRTLAATNFAVYLAKLGLKVIIIDFDLDAPGVDSKFPDFEMPKGEVGLIDYILRFQREGSEPGPISEILCSVPVASPRQAYALGLIPAGDYLAADYSAKLNELDWSAIFSDQRDGVAFFQLFLARIKQELSPDVVVIDSRTGFSEIGGLCTQQLADETVILSSLSRESMKMTRHLARVIRESQISTSLNKEVETKVVVSRVPRPRSVDKLKAQCCRLFDVDETKLFFLFSCARLEQEEFVAMLDTSKEDILIGNYIQLFQGLDVDTAQESIAREIARAEQGLLSCKPDEAEARIREMVALYPHPEVYRRAMRFFNLTRRPDEALPFCLRLLDFVPGDTEAQTSVAKFVLHGDMRFPYGLVSHRGRGMEALDLERLLAIAERAYEGGALSVAEKVRLAACLEDANEHGKSFQMAKRVLDSGEIEDPELRLHAMEIAARTAMKTGNAVEATRLVSEIPIGRLRGGLAEVALRLKIEAGEKEAAFELAKMLLARSLNPAIIEKAVQLSVELNRRSEVDEAIRANPDLESVAAERPDIIRQLEQLGLDVAELRERLTSARRARHGR